jgi:CheY-like chemotaxis protein
LAICRAIIKEHGGRIWAESPLYAEGRGARFVVAMPRAGLAERPSVPSGRKAVLEQRLAAKGINRDAVLVVDDDQDLVRIHREVFEKEGYRVLSAVNGREALRVAREELPGFIFMDVLLPDIDGFDVASILKNDRLTRDIPIVFTTVLGDEGRERGLVLGSGYLSKPFKEEDLVSAVKEYYGIS